MTFALVLQTPFTAPMLDAFLELKRGTLWAQYAKFNPNESAGIDSYWNGGPRPAPARTATGRALLAWADLHRGL